MPSPVTTSGFGVSERLNPQYLDPRLLVADSQPIFSGIQNGMNTVGQFAQIYDQAQSAPIRRQLQQIQLDEAKARLSMLPLEQQLAQIRLAEAQQNAAIPQNIVEGVDIVGGDAELVPRNLDAGFGNIEFDERFTPRERVTRGTSVAAGGVRSPFEKRETLLTASQAAADAEKARAAIDATKALSAQRAAGKTYESEALIQGYQEAVDSGDVAGAKLYKSLLDRKSMAPGILPTGTVYGRELEKTAARIGIPVDQIAAIAETPEGASAISKLSQQQAIIKAGRSFIPPSLRLNAAEQEIRRMESAQLQASTPGASPDDAKLVRTLTARLDTERKLSEELRALARTLTRVAESGWTPDLDDGIVLCAAPFADALLDWTKDPAEARKQLRAGKYPWSRVHQFRERW